MTEIDINELSDARFMGLMCPAGSYQSKSLVNAMVELIISTEQRKRARKHNDLVNFKDAVSRIVGDLLIALEVKEAGWSYHPMSPASFNDRPVGYKTFKSIVATMETNGLIEVSLGRNARGIQFEGMMTPTYHPSLATRFRPTSRLKAMAIEASVDLSQVRGHFPQQLPKNVIEVRGKSRTVRGVKTKGKKLRVVASDKTKAMATEVRELNRFLAGFELEGGNFSGYRRLFSNGDAQGFDFQWGGRLYGVGDHSYQGMKQQDRAEMKISGEEVVEIDINASYLTILYGLTGYPLPSRADIYEVEGVHRAVIKAWITSTIGHHGFHTRWPKTALDEIKAAGVEKPASMTMTSLQPTILDHFPMLADWPSQKITWADLMFIESEIVMGTMVELMRSSGVPCFSVHDSIIVRKRDEWIASDTLVRQFKERANVEPRLKTKKR